MPKAKTQIEQVKGIIYSLRCIPTNMIYIGQTLSHVYTKGYWNSHSVEKRFKYHLLHSTERDTKFYKDLLRYKDEWEMDIVQECDGDDIHNLNKYESEAMQEFDSIYPNGYNINPHPSTMTKSKKMLLDFYGLEQQDYFEKKTGGKSASFLYVSKKTEALKYKNIIRQKQIDKLIAQHVEQVKISYVPKNGQARIYVKLQDGSTYRMDCDSSDDAKKCCEEAIEVAQQLVDEPILTESAKAALNNYPVYEYESKLEEWIKHDFRLVSGRPNFYKTRNNHVYLIIGYTKDGQQKRITFGGKKSTIQESFDKATEFVNLLKDCCEEEFECRMKEVSDL